MRIQAGFLIRNAASWFGPRTALTSVVSGAVTGSATFEELNRSANRLGSGLLALGAARGDRVGVLAHNVPEVVQAWIGCEKHNLVRVGLHTHIGMDQHVWALDHLAASTVLFDTRFTEEIEKHRAEMRTVRHLVAVGPDAPDWAVPYADVVAAGSPGEPDVDVDEDAVCLVGMTSGTTGRPKPWIISYRSWHAFVDHNLHHLDTFGPSTPPVGADDVNLHFHALQWASGIQTLYPYLIRGARTVLLDDAEFDPDVVLATITSAGVTATFAPAPLWTPVLDAVAAHGGTEHRLRRVVIFFGYPDILDRTTALIGPVWAHGFGATEQGAVTTRLLPSEMAEKPSRRDSVGRAGGPFFEVAIKDGDGNTLGPNQTGEIVVRSAMSLGEYWGMPEQTARMRLPGGWLRSSDVGYLDEDGFLFYADRAGDSIRTAAGVVYPHLVEAALARHDAVANCGVVGLGEAGAQIVVAAVQLKPGRQPSEPLAAEILAMCSGLPEPERPERVTFLDELPSVLGGAKVQRSALRTMLESHQGG